MAKKIILYFSLTVLIIFGAFYYFMWGSNSDYQELSSVNTTFKFFGADHTIGLAQFKDPEAVNVICYLNRAKTGGIKGSIGIAEDSADVSLSCVQKGNVDVSLMSQKATEVFRERRNIGFKKLQVLRIYDKENDVFVYTAYSDKIIEGDSISATSAVFINNNAFK